MIVFNLLIYYGMFDVVIYIVCVEFEGIIYSFSCCVDQIVFNVVEVVGVILFSFCCFGVCIICVVLISEGLVDQFDVMGVKVDLQ